MNDDKGASWTTFFPPPRLLLPIYRFLLILVSAGHWNEACPTAWKLNEARRNGRSLVGSGKE
jgi:hypothetical protein